MGSRKFTLKLFIAHEALDVALLELKKPFPEQGLISADCRYQNLNHQEVALYAVNPNSKSRESLGSYPLTWDDKWGNYLFPHQQRKGHSGGIAVFNGYVIGVITDRHESDQQGVIVPLSEAASWLNGFTELRLILASPQVPKASTHQSPRRYTLRQRGQALCFEADSVSETELDAPGSPLTEIWVTAPHVQFQRLEADGLPGKGQMQPLEQPIPLAMGERLLLRSDHQALLIDSIRKPDWAEAIGRDTYGLYADFSVQGVVQRMRWIVPGEFLMGSPEGEAGRGDNETQHKVTLSQGYWLADTACTQALWQAVMDKNPSRFQGENKPVEKISWEDVQRFIERLNVVVPGQAFRLPTEAEWEYACRAGSTGPFWFGDQITPEQVNYNGEYPYAGGKKGVYRKETVAVKALPCNSWGLYQMHGNVWEWCQDWYGDYGSAAVVDPVGPAEGGRRVLRGGSWIFNGGYARSAQRYAYVPGRRSLDAGFRLARGQVSRLAPEASKGSKGK